MNVIAIDPGPERSALVYLEDGRPVDTLLDSNGLVRACLLTCARKTSPVPVLVLEEFESMGMAVGREVFRSVFWAGRFAELWPSDYFPVTRREVKLHLCRSMRAKDANIRQALIDRYGGKEKAIGRKGSPGPLYSIRADLWSALALGLTYLETQASERIPGDIQPGESLTSALARDMGWRPKA